MGNIHFELGDYNKAIECYQQSLDIALAIRDKPLEGAHTPIWEVPIKPLECIHKLCRFTRKPVPYAKAVGDKRMEGQMLGNLGTAYNSIGNHQERA